MWTSPPSGGCWTARSRSPRSPPSMPRRWTCRSAPCGCAGPSCAVAKRRSSAEEMGSRHKLAKRAEAERRRIIHQFIDDAFGDLDANPDFVAMMRSAMPELPDDPSPEQVDAWVELAELVQDPDFKASVRRMAELQAAERAADEPSGSGLHQELTNQLRARIEAALPAGIDPTSRQARLVLADLGARDAQTFG